jgi:prolyl oligopeptidase
MAEIFAKIRFEIRRFISFLPMMVLVLIGCSLAPVGRAPEVRAEASEADKVVPASAPAGRSESPTDALVQGIDDFRNLLDSGAKARVQKWVAAQNLRTETYVKASPIYSAIEARAKELVGSNPPVRTSLQGIEIFVRSKKLIFSDGASERVLVDLVALDPTESTSIAEFKLSPDGKRVAVAFAVDGSDISNWSIYDIASAQKLPDPPVRIRMASLTWESDSSGYFYSKWPDQATEDKLSMQGQKRSVPILFHKLGETSATDRLFFEAPDRPQTTNWAIDADSSGAYIAHRTQGSAEIPVDISIGRATKSGLSWKRIKISGKSGYGKYLGILNGEIILRTSEVGDRFGLMAIDINSPQKQRTLVKEVSSEVLLSAQLFGDRVLARYVDAKLENVLRVYGPAGELLRQWRPSDFSMNSARGDFSEFTGSRKSQVTYFTYSSLAESPQTFALDMSGLSLKKMPSAQPSPISFSKIDSKLTSYQSFDGVQVPIETYFRNDIREKPKFVFLFYYGSIGIANNPWFNRVYHLALEMGGMVAIAHIRGGGELGMKWQMAAKRDRMIAIKDIAWASRWLKQNVQIAGDRIVASGRSFGGMHTYASYVHFNDDMSLFVPVVPVSNAVDFLSGGHFGWMAGDDFGVQRDQNGSAVWSKGEVDNLKLWDPFANLNKLNLSKIKPMISFTGSTDERVDSYQTYAMTYWLQKNAGAQAPIYMYQNRGGHTNRGDYLMTFAFIAQNFGLTEFLPIKD